MRTQLRFCTSSVQLKTAASRNDPPFKTLGLKLQNNTMTTSVRSRNSICLHLFAACAQSCGISRLHKPLLVFPKPCHIHLRSLAPPHAYLRSPAAIMSTNLPNLSVPQGISTRHAQKQVGTPVDKLILLAWHDSRLDRLTCHAFTARCKGASPTIQSTTILFLQHVTRQAKAWPLAPSSNTSFLNCNLLSGSLNTTCVGPESRLIAQTLAETQALGIKQNIGCRDKCRWPIECADSASFLHFLTSEDSEPFVGLS